MMINKLLISISFLFALLLSACNTVQGVGKDIKSGGEKIEDAAQKIKNTPIKNQQ